MQANNKHPFFAVIVTMWKSRKYLTVYLLNVQMKHGSFLRENEI